MGLIEKIAKREPERMPDLHFKLMNVLFHIIDFVYPYIDKRVQKFGICPNMTVVDYGCGPGRYSIRFARLVGTKGKVFTVDIHKLPIEAVKKKIEKYGLRNIVPILAKGYDSTLPEHTADVVCAIDMFFLIKNPTEFLKELKRIIRPDGFLVIDDGHQRRSVTKTNILASGHWDINEETNDYLKCRPKSSKLAQKHTDRAV
jgi:ubiquinone/menaquinone biosynthesis C-methylase UbiE